MSASIGLSAASEKSREFPAFSTGRGNAFCLRHVGDARHVGDGGYSPCLFGYVTMWVGASQSDAHQPIRTSVSETKEAVYRPMRGASWDEEQTNYMWKREDWMFWWLKRYLKVLRHKMPQILTDLQPKTGKLCSGSSTLCDRTDRAQFPYFVGQIRTPVFCM